MSLLCALRTADFRGFGLPAHAHQPSERIQQRQLQGVPAAAAASPPPAAVVVLFNPPPTPSVFSQLAANGHGRAPGGMGGHCGRAAAAAAGRQAAPDGGAACAPSLPLPARCRVGGAAVKQLPSPRPVHCSGAGSAVHGELVQAPAAVLPCTYLLPTMPVPAFDAWRCWLLPLWASAPDCALRPFAPHPLLLQDKEAKLSYLTKLVEAISSTLGQPVPARPSKIVAGLEPEATNAMLRMLAGAATGTSNRGGPTMGSAASRYAQPAGLAAHCSADSEAGLGAEASVVFRRVDNLLPALARQCSEARSTLAAGAAPGSRDALALVEQVAGIATDAAVLARSLEQLLSAVPVIAAEAAAWRAEADKLAARLAEEEQEEARASAAGARRMADRDAQLAAARQRVAAAAVRR